AGRDSGRPRSRRDNVPPESTAPPKWPRSRQGGTKLATCKNLLPGSLRTTRGVGAPRGGRQTATGRRGRSAATWHSSTSLQNPSPQPPLRFGEGEQNLSCSPSPLRGGGWGEGFGTRPSHLLAGNDEGKQQGEGRQPQQEQSRDPQGKIHGFSL